MTDETAAASACELTRAVDGDNVGDKLPVASEPVVWLLVGDDDRGEEEVATLVSCGGVDVRVLSSWPPSVVVVVVLVVVVFGVGPGDSDCNVSRTEWGSSVAAAGADADADGRWFGCVLLLSASSSLPLLVRWLSAPIVCSICEDTVDHNQNHVRKTGAGFFYRLLCLRLRVFVCL